MTTISTGIYLHLTHQIVTTVISINLHFWRVSLYRVSSFESQNPSFESKTPSFESQNQRNKTRLSWLLVSFYARQHIWYSAYMPRQFRQSVCLPVRLSHAWFASKRPDRPIILVFRHQGSLRKCDGFTPKGGGRRIQGGSDFRTICGYILQTVIDRCSYYGRRI